MTFLLTWHWVDPIKISNYWVAFFCPNLRCYWVLDWVSDKKCSSKCFWLIWFIFLLGIPKTRARQEAKRSRPALAFQGSLWQLWGTTVKITCNHPCCRDYTATVRLLNSSAHLASSIRTRALMCRLLHVAKSLLWSSFDLAKKSGR